MKVAHVITGLFTGGAEMMLYKLLSGLDRRVFDSEVISLADGGPLAKEIQALGIPVRALGMRRGVPSLPAVYRLANWLRRSSPQVVQTWMYHADLAGGLAARLTGGVPVVWNIHHAGLERSKRLTRLIARLCAQISDWLPARIICCSEASRKTHTDFGYASDRMVVIPNGFDVDVFEPDPEARRSVRGELGIAETALLIGLVGNFRPEKDHRNFVEAAGQLHATHLQVHFVLCGERVSWDNPELRAWIEAAGIRTTCHLLGPRTDIKRINAALDIACSSSWSEAFSIAIGEAMACAAPCVVTDAGDSAMIVGETGIVVPPRHPEALAAAWKKLLGLAPEARRELGLAARRRIQKHFSLSTIIGKYQRLYEDVAFKRAP